MEPKKNRTYTKEFRIEALNLVNELGSYSEAARQLGIGDALLHSWKKKYNFTLDSKANKNAAVAVAESEEMKRLRKENEELKKINHILKRAAAFFSQDHLK
jgi:transposase